MGGETDFRRCEYYGAIVKETDKAICLTRAFDDVEMWLPKSQVGTITYEDGGDSVDVRVNEKIEAIQVAEWLADREGL